ncbi:MAG: hypothetical protein ACKPHU_16225, partial [Planctomycetaceae bacterium]
GYPRRRRRHTEIQHALNAPVATESLEDRTLLSTLMVGAGQTYTTIQSAVNAATTSDTIQVFAGDYSAEGTSRELRIGNVGEWSGGAGHSKGHWMGSFWRFWSGIQDYVGGFTHL